jgi:DNA-binding NarL/FixJ family response regulator
MTEQIRLIIAEDNPLVAWGVRLNLIEERGYRACGWAETAIEALNLAEKHRPDLVVIDAGLAHDPDGSAAVRAITDRLGIPVILCAGRRLGELDGAVSGALGLPA